MRRRALCTPEKAQTRPAAARRRRQVPAKKPAQNQILLKDALPEAGGGGQCRRQRSADYLRRTPRLTRATTLPPLRTTAGRVGRPALRDGGGLVQAACSTICTAMAASVVIDASAVIAVVTNEPHKPLLIRLTEGVELLSPSSLPVEVGNAFSAMFKRRRISLANAKAAIEAYQRIAIRLVAS